ncbi:ATP-binding protein [Streptomyces sp. HPF1205]|uniref:ATP-binding protein n=1 Tax=Streptomyces sp. HPF1205 TaxID=2873262 RepID=UPI001CEC2763|nr:ATP-binding protein [Streptomyces sp. HPF1205]
MVSLWLRNQSGRADEGAAGEAQRQQVREFWQSAGTSLQGAVDVLRASQEWMVKAHQDWVEVGAGQGRDFRNVTSAWLSYYRRSIDGIVVDVKALLEDVRQGKVPDRPAFPALPTRPWGMFDELDRNLALLGHSVRDAVVQAAAANTGTADAELDVFAGIAKRLRSRADRVLVELDGLERSTEDPDSLQALLRVDHKVVQIRRDVEAVTVLAGGQLRQSGGPADLFSILRQATAEIEDYGRVHFGDVAPVQVTAYARTALIHVLAALLENATRFSRDEVRLSSTLGASGLAVTVEDKGLHMPADDLRMLNALLADADPAIVRARLVEGRIGLLLAAKLAHQYRLEITLQPAEDRGTKALVIVPASLLLHPSEQPAPAPVPALSAPTAAVVPPRPAPADAPASLGQGLASVSALPFPEQPGAVPVVGTASGSASTAQESVPGGEGQRPSLPRRRRAVTASAPAGEVEHPASGEVATAGLVGAFLQGTQQAGDSSPPADEPAGPVRPATP